MPNYERLSVANSALMSALLQSKGGDFRLAKISVTP
jgi:hypothetical protein